MGAAATVLYVWSTVQECAIALIIAVVIIAIGISLWRFDVLRKRKRTTIQKGFTNET